MAISDIAHALTIPDLKRVKNRVIGNPKAKEALVRDEVFMRRLVDCLDPSLSSTSTSGSSSSLSSGSTLGRSAQENVELRTEAAHIVGSLCYGTLRPLTLPNRSTLYSYSMDPRIRIRVTHSPPAKRPHAPPLLVVPPP
ncbi:hypothetical protein NMY22_g16518 [Coprinellus aureogranulatus]|nr:hypothetical protein NMY22_g16518 [Coprinellus aureogranulatus]